MRTCVVLLVIPENPANAGKAMNISVLVGKVAKRGAVARSAVRIAKNQE
jgi:hypothetical protein